MTVYNSWYIKADILVKLKQKMSQIFVARVHFKLHQKPSLEENEIGVHENNCLLKIEYIFTAHTRGYKFLKHK